MTDAEFMTDAEKVKALQAKYARGWRNGWCTPGWVEFLEELARELPTVRVPVRQLRLDRRAGTSQAWDTSRQLHHSRGHDPRSRDAGEYALSTACRAE